MIFKSTYRFSPRRWRVLILIVIVFMSSPRALSVEALLRKKYDTLEWSESFHEAFGNPTRHGVWFIWGDSGNGKTSFVLQLCRELTKFGRVAFNSLEEGYDKTLQDAIARLELSQQQRRRMILLHEDMDALRARMDKHKSPQFVIVDSIQYTGINFNEYLALKRRMANKLLVFVSQVEGKQPAGRTANRVMFDASLKIWVEGYRAFSKGRYIGDTGHYDIWPEAAMSHWGTTTKNQQV